MPRVKKPKRASAPGPQNSSGLGSSVSSTQSSQPKALSTHACHTTPSPVACAPAGREYKAEAGKSNGRGNIHWVPPWLGLSGCSKQSDNGCFQCANRNPAEAGFV